VGTDTPQSGSILGQVEQALRAHYGVDPARASISFVGVEPIEILRFAPTDGEICYVSLGMSRRPMTGADELIAAPGGPRAELMIRTRHDASDPWRQLAVLAAGPAVEGVVYRPGATIDLGSPLADGSRCTGGLLAESGLPTVTLGGATVDVLQVLPATQTELAWCRVRGSAALAKLWADQRTDLLDLARLPARLE
jgi:Suppressor of fused protein (SUFU)